MTLQSQGSGLFIPLLIHIKKERFNDEEIVCVLLLDTPEPGARCCRCQQRKTLHWYVEDADGCWGLVCKDCGEALMEKLRRRGDAET